MKNVTEIEIINTNHKEIVEVKNLINDLEKKCNREHLKHNKPIRR